MLTATANLKQHLKLGKFYDTGALREDQRSISVIEHIINVMGLQDGGNACVFQ